MKKSITKKVISELKVILDQTGYWSNETKNYISEFTYLTASKLHAMAQTYTKYGYGMEVK